MAYQVLARKWRPKQFEEVVGQAHVTRTLQNAIKHEKLAHAYLFTGTRGVGKTSIARLFAKAIRCENRKPDFNPCLECQSCKDIDAGNSMDYIEIDGASNNSVDDVRSLIENVQYLPTRGQFKIYVVDEVHMLSVSAFNALLKTLEEPPAHAIFILATTDPHKLLGTVISRCQRYDFKNVSVEILREHVLKIASIEKIQFSSPAIAQKLAELGKGSVRDTLSLFDQVLGLAGTQSITEENLTAAVGLAGTNAMRTMLSSILIGNALECRQTFLGLMDENVDLKKLCDQILDNLYKIINSIDQQHLLIEENVIFENSLNGITIAELFWIYESMIKDFTWALSSINPEKAVLVILQKLSLRRTILKGEGVKIQEVPQAGKSEAGAKITIEAPRKILKTWEGFIDYLRQGAPATAANIEHGNLIDPLNMNTVPFVVRVGFKSDAVVFKEYLEEKEVYSKLKNHLADFFEIDIEKFNLNFQLLSEEQKKDKNFRSKVEIDDETRRQRLKEREQSILNDPFVKEAEKLFNAKIDKIILKD
jgi:DNA polymerase-3 subunit gamma/tau